MADEIKVSPTPIQRNAHDVAMELTNIFLNNQYASDKPMEIDYLSEIYLKFYSTAKVIERSGIDVLKKFVPDELK